MSSLPVLFILEHARTSRPGAQSPHPVVSPHGLTPLPAHISSTTNTFSSSQTRPHLVSKPDLCFISLKLPSNESEKKHTEKECKYGKILIIICEPR